MQLAAIIRSPAAGRALVADLAPPARASSSMPRWIAPAAWIAGAAILATVLSLRGREVVAAVERALHASWHLVLLAALFEAASLAGYVFLQHRVLARGITDLRLKDSYDITMAGTAATRLLPTAGLGGAAVAVWALRARGMRAAETAERLLAFMLLLYAVYMGALLMAGAAIAFDLVPVHAGQALGVLGAAAAIGVAAGVLMLFAAPERLGLLLRRAGSGSGRAAGAAARAHDQLPVLRSALDRAGAELRRPHPALFGAVAWWGFDIAILVTMLHAFGVVLPIPAIVLAYFLGTMFNLLPVPGSLSGGLAGALIALGTPAGSAIAAVLAYRAIAVWLPAGCGVASLASLRTDIVNRRRSASAEVAS
jgi:putative heme transporter